MEQPKKIHDIQDLWDALQKLQKTSDGRNTLLENIRRDLTDIKDHQARMALAFWGEDGGNGLRAEHKELWKEYQNLSPSELAERIYKIDEKINRVYFGSALIALFTAWLADVFGVGG